MSDRGMSDAERDPIVRRAIDELRRLPAIEESAVRRVVSAAAAARVAPAVDEPFVPVRRMPRVSAAMLVGVAAAAAIVGFALRGVWSREPRDSGEPRAPAVAASAPAADSVTHAVPGAMAMRSVASSPNDALPIPQQFVIHAGAAHRVAVVGDFNRWNAKSAPMTRSDNSGLWSVTIPILPGRHMYGFIVDDSTFVLDPDPRVAKARDTDLGVEGSIVIVGRP